MIQEHCLRAMASGLSVLCLLLPAAPVQAATVYKCVDEQGRVEYSNLPCPGGVRMDIPTDTPSPAPEEPRSADGGRESPARPAQTAAFAGYSRFAIAGPQGAEVIRDNSGSGTVAVELSIAPALRGDLGHTIAVYLDGTRLPRRYTGPQFTLSGLDEGTHTLRVAVAGADGSELASSGTTTFGLLRVAEESPRGPEVEQPGAEDQPRLPGTPPFPKPMGVPQPGTEDQPRLPSKPPIPDPMTPPVAPTPLPAPPPVPLRR